MTQRPTFFLSSTIYDFRDLRGAIKYYLESRGCSVLASECVDFHGNLDQHSYEACLSKIDAADHFILLVGGRVGAWYNKAERTSITQQEYRHAYARHKAGVLRLVPFVRDEVWQLREDRKALTEHLATLDLSAEERRTISNFPSKFADDAEFIGGFITEIGRNLETALAVERGGSKPTGNWIHVFHDFDDIAEVLHPLTFSGLTADEAAYRKALQHELIEILRRLLLKLKGKVFDPRGMLAKHFEAQAVTAEERDEIIRLSSEKWGSFSTLMFHLFGKRIELTVVNDALTSSLFMQYDGVTGTYVQTEAYRALAKLIEEVRMFNNGATTEVLSTIIEFSPRSIGRGTPADIPGQKLALLHGLALRWINIISLSEALIKHLEGQPFVPPTLMPFSPIKGMEEEIAKEAASYDDARNWLGI